jgi:hypothetical protein
MDKGISLKKLSSELGVRLSSLSRQETEGIVTACNKRRLKKKLCLKNCRFLFCAFM